jgi:hypothetical protein
VVVVVDDEDKGVINALRSARQSECISLQTLPRSMISSNRENLKQYIDDKKNERTNGCIDGITKV